MEPVQRQGLRQSIQKWHDILFYGEEEGDCPLCDLNFNEDDRCWDCCIYIDTRAHYCKATPYYKFYNKGDWVYDDESAVYAANMLYYLEGLYARG